MTQEIGQRRVRCGRCGGIGSTCRCAPEPAAPSGVGSSPGSPHGPGRSVDAAASTPSASGVPAPVQVVQVILGLGAVGALLLAVLLGVPAMVMLSALGSSGAGLVVLLGIAYLVGSAVLRLRIKAALADGNRRARDLLTALLCVDVLAALLLTGDTGPGGILSVVVDCGAAALLWLPPSARRHFGDPPLPQGWAGRALMGGEAEPPARPAAASWTPHVATDPVTIPIPIPIPAGYWPNGREAR